MITREEQLKYCEVCQNRAVGPNHETICQLTNAKADFDPTCPNYVYDKYATKDGNYDSSDSGTSSWRIILGVIVVVLAIIRWGIRCNRMNDHSSNDRSSEQIEALMEDIKRRNQDHAASLSAEDRAELGMSLTTEESEKNIDKFMTFRVPRNWYIFENLTDEKTKLIIRDKNNFMVCVAKLPLSNDVKESWKKMRLEASNQIVESTLTYNSKGDDLIEYSIKNSLMNTKGYAKIYTHKGFAYFFQCEHSSKSLSEVRQLFDRLLEDCVVTNP